MTRRFSPPKRRSRAHDKHALDVKLGEQMFVHGVALHGASAKLLKPHGWRRFLVEIAFALGMTPIAKAKIWNYPLHGAGGNGSTVIQPISESFLIVDTWRDHAGCYLFICSCKRFDTDALASVFKQYCLTPGDAVGAPAMLRLR